MDVLIGSLLFAAMGAAGIGLYKLILKQGQRLRGLFYVIAAFVIVVAGGALVNLDNERAARAAGFASYDAQIAAEVAEQERRLAEHIAQREAEAQAERDRLDARARENGFENHAAQQEAERRAAEMERARAAAEALEGFPDARTQREAKSLGITRYAAYTQLRNIETIRAYCAYNTQLFALETDKFARIDAGGDEAKITVQTEAAQTELRERFNTQFGLISFELNTLSIAGHWDIYCSAFDRNWGVFGVNSASRVDLDTAQRAQDVLLQVYTTELGRHSALALFNPTTRAVAECERVEVEGYHYVGCRLKSARGSSRWYLYLIGEGSNGRLLHNPIHGPSISATTTIWNTLPTDLRDQITPANFAGPRLPIAKVIQKFQ